MRTWKLSAVAVAVAAAFPGLAQAQAASADAVLKELQDLKARVLELEKKLKEAEAKPAAAGPAGSAQWGMTPEQVQEFNRIAVKTEATEDNLEMWGMKGLTISGYIEPAFIWNKRQDRAGFQFLNQQGDGYFYDTSYIGAASIDFTKETDSGTRWKLTLTPNRGVGAAMDGASIVQEATVSIPLSDLQTRLLVGQVPDWSGYEYQQPTLNPFTTHNLLYDFTLPVSYTGAGFDIMRGKWWYRAIVGNVNSAIKAPGDKGPVLAYRVDYSKGEFNGFGFAGLHGKAPNFNTGENTTAHLFEIDGYFIRGDWTVQGQFSYGQQKQGAATTDANQNYRDSRWYGVSGLVGYNVTPRLQLLARADYIQNEKNGGGLFGYNGFGGYEDDDGNLVETAVDGRNGIGVDGNLLCYGADVGTAACNKGANRYALSLGMKYAFNQNTTFKAEYRFDGANKAVFFDNKNETYEKNNHLFGASVVVFF